VPVYLGYDERYNIHYFHDTETQEVELNAWYFPGTGTIELVYGTNLYTRADMSPNWVKALDVDPNWSHRLSQVAKTAYQNIQDDG
jgi:hypothetical protein